MPKVIGVITAKLSATGRIPNKILLPLAGPTVLTHHIERMQLVQGLDGVFVATSRWPGNEIVTEIAKQSGVESLAGSEHDVIERHIALCQREQADAVIRITADTPLFDIASTESMIEQYQTDPTIDYLFVKNVPFELSMVTELVTLSALNAAHAIEPGPAVTLPIWEHWQDFKCIGVVADERLGRSGYNFSLDHPIDYVVLGHIFRALYRNTPIPTLAAIEYLDEHPEIAHLNVGAKQSAINRRFMEAQRHARATEKTSE